MAKIYIDISDLLKARYLSGIQRVVRTVCHELAELKPADIVLLSCQADPEKFRIVPLDYFERRFVNGDNEAELPSNLEELSIDSIAAGSVFLDLDSFWDVPLKRTVLVPELKARGIKWLVYVYDVCPVSMPQYSHPNTVFQFIEYIGTIIGHADGIIVSTHDTASALKQLCLDLGRKCPPLSVSSLGCDFREKEYVSHPDEEVVAALKGKRFVLSVGTIEPRKNQSLLIDAFDAQLFAEDLSLVLVGRIGWNCSDIKTRIDASPFNGSQLFHFSGIDDDTLVWLYANAFATAMPTLAEGFGLPVVESLLHGTPTLVSDIPVMREIGGGCALYFDNRDERDFAHLVDSLLSDEAAYADARAKAASYVGVTWHEVGERIVQAIDMLAPPMRKPLANVRQLVLLTARFEDAQTLLPYINRLMPFIEEVLLICPDELAARGAELEGGRLRLSFLSDSEILDGQPLPEDHAKRNFYLRCLAMKSDLLDDVFIMSDDDYRPMTTITRDVFVDENHYKGYYSYDLRKWLGSTSGFSSFDKAVFAEREFLRENGYPMKQYACHMPQIIDKSIFLEMLAAHPGMETKGYLDWDVYFNFLQAQYPSLLEVLPHVALCWPGAPTDWPVRVKQPRYLYENHYAHLYGEKGLFAGIPDTLDGDYEENCRKKIARYDAKIVQFMGWQRQFDDYTRLYEKRHGLRPFFKVRVRDDGIVIRMPDWVDLPSGGFVRIPVRLVGNCEGVQVRYRLKDAHGNVILDIKDRPVRIVPEPPILSLPVFTAPGMAFFELYTVRGDAEYSASTPICRDKPVEAPAAQN